MRTGWHGKAAAVAVALLIVGTVVVSGQVSPSAHVDTLSEHLASATRVAKEGNGSGYWLVSSTGEVFTFGTAKFYGSMAGRHLNAPITGIVATADHRGYWLVAKDCGVFSFGDAIFHGSLRDKTLAAPVVGMATSSGGGSKTTGPQVPAGATGASGATGTNGTDGATGATRPLGPTGPTGTPGAAGAPDYAYIYAMVPHTVEPGANVLFDGDGPTLGFVHVVGASSISVNLAGTYRIDFSVSATQLNQFAVSVNNVVAPSSLYGAGAGTDQNAGRVILTLAASDVLRLTNHTSAAGIGLDSVVGGTQANVTASLLIEQLR